MERSRTCVKAEACACASACGIYTQPVSKRASREDVMASSLVHTAPIQSICSMRLHVAFLIKGLLQWCLCHELVQPSRAAICTGNALSQEDMQKGEGWGLTCCQLSAAATWPGRRHAQALDTCRGSIEAPGR